MRWPVAAAVALAAALAPGEPAHADATSEDRVIEEVAYAAGSALGTLVYAPIKGAFCVLGAVAGAATLVVAGPDEAGKVMGLACRGTWIITPEIMRGARPIDLLGDAAGP